MGEIHAVSEGAEVVVEEPGVDVEGHRCGGVTKHPLDRLDVRAAGYQQARGGVPEVVRGDVGQPGRLDGGVEDQPPPVAEPQSRASSPSTVRTAGDVWCSERALDIGVNTALPCHLIV